MDSGKPVVVVTGVSGNLGTRLLSQIDDFSVVGIDVNPPKSERSIRFVRMDLGKEESCLQLIRLLKELHPVALVHLAFVLDQVRAGVLDLQRMWQINVAGMARVMEAIAEANRDQGGVEKLIFPGSVSASGQTGNGPFWGAFPLPAITYLSGWTMRKFANFLGRAHPSLA